MLPEIEISLNEMYANQCTEQSQVSSICDLIRGVIGHFFDRFLIHYIQKRLNGSSLKINRPLQF